MVYYVASKAKLCLRIAIAMPTNYKDTLYSLKRVNTLNPRGQTLYGGGTQALYGGGAKTLYGA